MSQEKTLPRKRQREEEAAAAPAPESGGNSLANQAAAYAQVAREALENCERGIDAERELHRRRNRSGQ